MISNLQRNRLFIEYRLEKSYLYFIRRLFPEKLVFDIGLNRLCYAFLSRF